MAQADGVVSNASGAAVRQDINNQLAAAFSTHSKDTAPSPSFPCQLYADTANDLLKIRDKTSNSNTFYTLRTLTGGVVGPAGTAAAPSIFFDGSTGTGFYKYANDVIGISKAGTAYGVIGRNIENQTNAFVIGNAATRATEKNPSKATDETATGFLVAGPVDAQDGGGQVHIGSSVRPLSLNRVGSNGAFVDFYKTGNFISSINTTNGTSINYNTGSDYRLKENVVVLTGAKDRVNQLKTYRFNFIGDPSNQVVDGFLAHEAQTVVPEAITGDKDATFDDGTPKYQQIDQSKIVPLLTAALQEAFAEIAALTARVEALEAN